MVVGDASSCYNSGAAVSMDDVWLFGCRTRVPTTIVMSDMLQWSFPLGGEYKLFQRWS